MTNFEIALITLAPMRAGDVRTFGSVEDPFKVKVRAVDTEGRADKAKRGPLCYSVEAEGLGGDAGMEVCQNLHLASACVVRALAAIRLDDDTARYPVGPWERNANSAPERFLQRNEWFARLDRLARSLLGMSGEEFIKAHEAGRLPDHPAAADLAAMISLAGRA